MTIASCKRVRRRRLLGIGTVVVAPLVRMMILLMSCTSSCRSGRNSGITWLALIVGQSCCRCCAAVPGVDATTPTTDETDDAGTSASAAAETETAESHFRGKNEEEKPQQLQPDEGDDVMSLPDWRGDDHGDETTQLPIAQGDRPKQVLYDNHHGPRTTIRVGDSVRYDPPFSQYPASVAVVLNRYPQSRGDDDVNDDDSGLLDKADWYLDLGLAHRSALEDDFAAGAKGPQSEGQGVWKQQQQQHERLAITAMLEAASIYEGLLLLYAKPQSAVTMTTTAAANLQHHLAASYFSLAETHALSSFHDFDNNPNSRQRLSTEYFQKAHDLYQQLLLLPQSNYPSKNEREDRLETQVSWAHCCLRLGVALLSRGPDRNHDNTWSSSSSSLPLDPSRLADLLETDGMMDWMDVSDVWGSGGGDGNDNLQHLLSQILRGGGSGGADDRTDSSSRILGSLTQQLGDAEKAMQYFTEAAVVFRQAAETGSTVAERLPHQQSLATTLQNLGTAATTLGDFETSLRRNEEALQLYTNVLMPALQNQQPSGVSEVTDTAIAVSEVLYTLADVYLQLGQHNPAKDRYRQCMEWNEKHNIDPPTDSPTAIDLAGDTADMLAGYEQRLQEYLEAFDGDTSGMLEDGYDEMLDELYEYNEKDDGYEGDLHLSIGALYMAQGGDNNLFAASHLEQAVRLYELSGERDGENTATAKFNLSILHLRGGDYRASAQLHGEALDIFRSVNEENVSLTGLLGVNELRTLMIQHPQRQESSRNDDQPSPSTKAKAASPATQTTTTTTRESHSSIKETKPSLQAAADHSDGPSILIDVNSFLNQNNSLKEEL